MYLCRIVSTSRVRVAVELCPFGRGALMLIIYFHVHVYYQVPGNMIDTCVLVRASGTRNTLYRRASTKVGQSPTWTETNRVSCRARNIVRAAYDGIGKTDGDLRQPRVCITRG